MITFDKERNAWNFKDATEDERSALMQMAENYWAAAMAAAIARNMMAEAAELSDTEHGADPLHDTVDFNGTH